MSRFPAPPARTAPLPVGATIDDRARVLADEIRQPPIGHVIAAPALQVIVDWTKAEVKAAVGAAVANSGAVAVEPVADISATIANVKADTVAATKAAVAAAIAERFEEQGGAVTLETIEIVIRDVDVVDSTRED